ncbi:MAG: hypothetical protein A2233_03925 [Candidatus Kerfeldbacteria bacterium RIFOXYA2_FULL_38_24]|uniref:Carbohydrate-binding domain-containing protein n=1 Tax=Candidatus Kerfeldbacteria bacterium RIFOXYB2_FULL_38_14 TaxID=1798547 RepID=A0A1G2BDV3_9BACT|nr:MAG: hypothetical protein A2233_03925 [Candidatus Kerfeldbacteria bacterium RIFOXYA2_FULL_38_24]OGY87215.1 MAG: hypothetical protein A2319_01045 [Candidatus Kerfeldbacteria bacterium RIFOXYB2_FULL_38_14]OGY88481.1 MAG: hypothetical protein A2458_01755 [Candidatus Kerfeldbacteria bacterium RIFOXYC2_FULL_38_9]
MLYLINKTTTEKNFNSNRQADFWKNADIAKIKHYHPQSNNYRPLVLLKALYDKNYIYVFFNVKEKNPHCTRSKYQNEAYKDSCVEFFVKPKLNKGYFNFEMGCGGALLLTYIENPQRLSAGGFKKYTKIPKKIGAKTKIQIKFLKTSWQLAVSIPLEIMEKYIGTIKISKRTVWRGNFYKCADESSRPHWGSWSPIGKELNFHCPQFFGKLKFN